MTTTSGAADRFFGVPVLPSDAVPAGLRVSAGFAAAFGTLWLVQGLLAAAGPGAAAAGLLPGLFIGTYLVRSRRNAAADAGRRGVQRFLAQRYVSRSTIIQLAVSVPAGVAAQLLVGPAAVLPVVIPTVGLYLLALAPALRRGHTAVAGAALTVLPLFTVPRFDGTDRTVATGIIGGALFLAKGLIDLGVARRLVTGGRAGDGGRPER